MATEKEGKFGEINSSWRWGEFSGEGHTPEEVVAEKIVGWETSPMAILLESSPSPQEHQKGSASFSVSGILATIELNGTTTTVNPLGETAATGSPEERYGMKNPGAPALDHGCWLGHPVDCATGNQVESQTDLAIGGRGLNDTRTYNSQLAVKLTSPGAFGYGWTGPYSAHLAFGEACNETHCTETVTVHQDNGSVVRFELGPTKTYIAGEWVEATLVKESGEYIYTLPNRSILRFNGSGELTSEADRNGNTTTVHRDAEGRIESVEGPGGRSLTFSYNGSGHVESVMDPLGNTVKYGYDKEGNLVSVTEPGETEPRRQFKYDSAHQLIAETDALGHTVTTEYDGNHRVIFQEDALKRDRTWKYVTTESGAETTVTEPNGSVTVEQFNEAGLPTSVTHASGTSLAATTIYKYDLAYNLLSVTDPNNHTTSCTYDANGNRLSRMDALEHTTEWSYDRTHDITREKTPDGETTTYELNSAGEPKEISRPAPGKSVQVTKPGYNAGTGNLDNFTDPLGRKWKYEYDSYGDHTKEVDPEGNIRTWEYNEDGQEVASVSPRGNIKEGAEAANYRTSTERDAQGRSLTVTDPLGNMTTYAYDTDGNLESMMDGNSNKTKYIFNADNEPIKVEEPSGTTTETGYDSEGQVTSQTDGNKHTITYVRNALERVVEVINPLERKTAKAYDTAGNQTKLTDQAKRTITHTYGADNRLATTSYSDGKTHAVEYEYNGDGFVTHMTDGTGSTSYTYDQLDRLTESVNGHKESVGYEYDLGNNLVKIVYPNKQSVVRTYDKDGRLQTVTDWLAHQTKFSYDEDSNLGGEVFPTSTLSQDKYTYDNTDRMSEAKMAKGAETLASLTYTRDGNGQIKTTVAKGLPGEEKASDTYDSNNRLTKAGTLVYGYDAADYPVKLGSGLYTYDNADQLKIGNGVKFAYNEVGQRIKSTPSGAATTYVYDQIGNVTAVEKAAEGKGAPVKDVYTYDGDNLLASQTKAGKGTNIAWEMAQGLPVMLTDGTNSYIYGPNGLPIEQVNNSQSKVFYLHGDQQGSTRMLTGSTGKAEATMTYDAYGNTTGTTGTATTPFGYDDQYTSSDTGLIYLRTRTYDPKTAQFLSVDPAMSVTRAPYNYAGDNPLNRNDPSGLGEWEPWTESFWTEGNFISNSPLNPIPYYEEEIESYENGCGYFPSMAHGIVGALAGMALFAGGEGVDEADITVSDLLKSKLGSIRKAPLPPGSPSWADIANMSIADVRAAAKANEAGFKTILKLLTEGKYNKP